MTAFQWLGDEFRWLANEFVITATNETVWVAIGVGLLCAGACLFFGTWVARQVGLLASDAPAGETVGVGLSSGLMVIAAWWAAIWSGGRSSFTPVAVGFAIAIVLAVVRRARVPADADAVAAASAAGDVKNNARRWSNSWSIVLTAGAAGMFIVAVALLYGLTMTPGPRDGVQPVEDRDVAFYAVLGRDLATTGTETNLSPSGFSELPVFSAQTWYHWGELWLASAVIQAFGTAPLAARYFVVLPVVLLAAAALTGSLVRRLVRTNSRGAYLVGFGSCLFLAPVPLIHGPFFSSWAVGMIYGITLYGLGAIAGLLALYSVVVLGGRTATWALAGFVGTAVAFILPGHLAIAVLALVGVGMVWTIRAIRVAVARRLPIVPPIWFRTIIATAIAIFATVVWGIATDHGIGSSSSSSVSPFNSSWRESVAITILGAGAFLAMPVAWFLSRREAPLHADLYLGAMGLLAFGAIGWGALLGDFTTFYLYFAGIAVFATPLAAAAVLTLWERLRATQHLKWALGLIILCLLQLDAGVASGIVRLQRIGPPGYEPLPISLLGALMQLPPEARLAYSCGPLDELAFGTPQLLSIDAHAGRRVVPMCFEAEFPSTLVGAERSADVVSQFFRGAPQRALYPDAAAEPSPAEVTTFLKQYGIDYIFADKRHPNTLVADAVMIATSGNAEILRVP